MKIIQNNPYRIAGILSNSSARELQKQKGKIKAFAKVGKEITSEFDFNLLDKIERTEQTIGKAFSNIEQNQDKVNNSLFWFLKASPFDETAISYLIKGDSEKAKEIWGKVTNGKEVNSKNFSAFNNIGTLKLLSKSEFEIKEGIKAKMKLIESGYFESFAHSVADQTFTIDNQKQSQKLIDELLMQFKNQYSSADTLDLFSNCNGSTQKYLSKKFTEEPIHNIESNIESTKRKRKNNKSDAYSFGLKLFANAKNDLSLLKSLLGTSDLKYKMVADNLAKEVMQCGIDYFKEWKESKDPSKESLKLLKYAKSIAIGTQTKERIDSNIDGLQEWVDTIDDRNAFKHLEEYCFYCDENKANSKYDFLTEMFKVTSRNSWHEKRKVSYNKTTVKINRCEQCFNIHEKSDTTHTVFVPVYILSLIIFIIKVAIPEGWNSLILFLFVGWIPALILNWIISLILGNINFKKYKIKTESDISTHLLVKEMVKEGWGFSEPTA